jgi:hypothetical protein
MAPDLDDRSIPQDAGLLRRIHPDQVIRDRSTGQLRPSSAAFKDPNLSVDVEPRLQAVGLDWHFSLRDNPSYSLVRFAAKSARDRGFAVVSKPLPDNPAHAEVVGKKTPGGANGLRDASEWVHLVGASAVP